MNALSDTVERKEAPGGWVIAEIHTPDYGERWLRDPANVRMNLAAIAKPLLDGVVAAFHIHDDPASLDLVASRVAAPLGPGDPMQPIGGVPHSGGDAR
ncbi:MAG: hypothetical protein M3O77_02870 [Chloroflexota bacterium]|nr:hypothetical protein [Chloroflexota bacterium]